MIRNLKVLGLALVAMLALGAVVASAASAQQGTLVTEGEEEVTLLGEETGTLLANSFTSPFGSITCDESTYKGEAVEGGLVEDGASEVAVTPTYVNCLTHIPILGTRPTTVTTDSCYFLLTVGETTEGEDTYGVKADLKCDTDIEIHIYKNTPEDPHTEEICHVTVSPTNNQDLTGAHLTDTTNGHIDLEGTFTGIHEVREGSLCPDGTGAGSSLHVDLTIDGENAANETVDVGLDH